MRKLVKTLIFAAALLISGIAGINEASAKDADGNIVIVIDPGHGGDDPGSIAPSTNVSEKDCNLAIAEAMKNELGKYDHVRVYLTRSGDQWITNSGRAMIASSLNADFLISIHNNSGSDSNSGCIGYRSLNEYYSQTTGEMCSLITGKLAELGFANGGVQTRISTQYDYEDYYTLIAEGVRAGIPSVIIEHCYLSNAEDAGKISNSDGTVNTEMAKSMGKADAAAVVQYFDLKERTAQADSTTSLTLIRGNSVKAQIPGSDGTGAVWQSSDESVMTVSDDGTATAVGMGDANVSYSLPDGTSGYLSVTVPVVEQIALTGAINPTFYDDVENKFSDIDLNSAFGVVTYSDGTAEVVDLDFVDEADKAKVGIQQLKVKYGDLTGKLMVCHNTADYKPEVTPPGDSEETETLAEDETEQITDSQETAETTQQETSVNSAKESVGTAKQLVKFIAVILILLIIAMAMAIIERNIHEKRRRRK